MKHLWILNHYAQEPKGAGGTRHFSLAKSLKNYGWNVSILAASVEHHSGTQRLHHEENQRIESYENVVFLWVKTPVYAGNTIRRVLNIVTYLIQVIRPSVVVGLQRPNAIVGSSVHPLAALAALILSRRYKVPFIFEVRDLWPQTLIDMGKLSERSFSATVLKKLERLLYKNAARIILLPPDAYKYVEALGISSDRIASIPNGVDLSLFPPQSNDSLVKGSNFFTLMYFGSHGEANGLSNLIHAMKILQRDKIGSQIRLRLIGDGPRKLDLIKLAKDLKLSNVIFESPIPKNDIPAIASEADAFVFNLIDSPVFNYGISSNKLFDFMASARPIIFCCNSSNNPISEAGAGITVKPGNPDDLANGILAMAQLPTALRLEMGQSAYRFIVKNHDFNYLAGQFAAVIEGAIKK
jgi:glycosyltransferase involved in cell wall biosynthesis